MELLAITIYSVTLLYFWEILGNFQNNMFLLQGQVVQ